MNDFKKRSDFVKRDFKRPAGKSFDRNQEMFQATCASCGKMCEVPFRPNGKKPVYCKNCFMANGGQTATPSHKFEPRTEYKKEYRSEAPQQSHQDLTDLKKQVEMMNFKLDTIVRILADNPFVGSETEVPKEKKGTTRKKK